MCSFSFFFTAHCWSELDIHWTIMQNGSQNQGVSPHRLSCLCLIDCNAVSYARNVHKLQAIRNKKCHVEDSFTKTWHFTLSVFQNTCEMILWICISKWLCQFLIGHSMKPSTVCNTPQRCICNINLPIIDVVCQSYMLTRLNQHWCIEAVRFCVNSGTNSLPDYLHPLILLSVASLDVCLASRTLSGAICNSIFSTIIDQAPFAIEDLMKEVKVAEASDSDSGQASEEDNEDDQLNETTSKPVSKKGTGKQINGTSPEKTAQKSNLGWIFAY